MAQDTIGTLVAARRSNMEMSLNALVQRMGGSPSASFLNRIETGKVTPTRRVAGRLADALSLPRDLVLNAAGHASEGQEGDALDQLRAMLGERAPVMVAVTVMDPKTAKATGERRQRMLRTRYDARLVDLDGEDNEPFAGEVVYDPDDEVRRGVGVVVDIDGRLSAWRVQGAGKNLWLENGRKEKRTTGYKILGVIRRVSKEVDL